MTELDYIKELEWRIQFLEGALERTIKLLDRMVTLVENQQRNDERE